ncbi:MAG: ribonuclease P protein component [Thermoanaerobaculia bacterium]
MSSDPSRTGSAPRVARRPESFGRDRRVLRRADFLETYSSGRRHVGRWLVFFVRPAGGARARLGVTVTKKTGSAVVRNRLRRRLRELFRRSDAFPAPVDVVVNVRPGAERTDFAELSRDFEKLARRAAPGVVR